MHDDIRVLLLADTHLGFDLPVRPRSSRRRRGHDFLANYAAALAPALAGEVDIVVHGGDVFHRPNVPRTLAYQALEPLARVAEQGIPVFVVPGNHERSVLRLHVGACGRVHVFDRPRTFVTEVRGRRIALAGFPYERRGVRSRFMKLLDASGWDRAPATLRLLCVHQCVEGATVGPGDYTFTTASDVIRAREIPAGLAAVLSGHIHRHQVLTHDLRDRPMAARVFYPGSVERTSSAEIGEPKGFIILHLREGAPGGVAHWEFRRLPARPMLVRKLVAGRGARALEADLRAVIAAAPPDAVLRIRVAGDLTAADMHVMSASRLRALAPPTMNIAVTPAAGFRSTAAWANPRRSRAQRPPDRQDCEEAQLDLGGLLA